MNLIFVYNAEADAMSRVLGFAHKIFRPSTYNCDLCNLTHSTLGERLLWKAFKKSTDANLSFYYRKEFEKKYGGNQNYPIIFVVENEHLAVLMNKQALLSCKNIEELIHTITTQIENKNELL